MKFPPALQFPGCTCLSGDWKLCICTVLLLAFSFSDVGTDVDIIEMADSCEFDSVTSTKPAAVLRLHSQNDTDRVTDHFRVENKPMWVLSGAHRMSLFRLDDDGGHLLFTVSLIDLLSSTGICLESAENFSLLMLRVCGARLCLIKSCYESICTWFDMNILFPQCSPILIDVDLDF